MAGAVLLPAFAIFCEIVFGVFIRADTLPYLILGGYMLGSLGIEALIQQADEAQRQAASTQVFPPSVPVPEPRRTLPSNRPPFEFADWDDEGPGR